MILRSVTKHVKDQNWFAVSIDFIIVVLGVYIGLEVANWNDARVDRRDEARILKQLRVEVASAESFARRVTQLRIDSLDDAVTAMDVLFDRTGRKELSFDECQSLRATGLISLRFVELLSFDELVSSGRLYIIRDDELRSALIGLRQSISAADRSIAQIVALQSDLVQDFPKAFKLISVINTEVTTRREIGVESSCDTTWMKNSQAFLNAATKSVDAYDAFIRDVVLPWRDGISRVHQRLKVISGVQNNEA